MTEPFVMNHDTPEPDIQQGVLCMLWPREELHRTFMKPPLSEGWQENQTTVSCTWEDIKRRYCDAVWFKESVWYLFDLSVGAAVHTNVATMPAQWGM